VASAWETRFAEFVRRAVGWRESSALEVLPDLMPVLPVLDAQDPAVRLTRRERRFAAWTLVGPGVGLFPTVQLPNPAASGCLAVVEEVWCFGGGSEWYADLFTGIGGGAAVPSRPLDGRITTPAQLALTGQTSGAGTYSLWRSLYSSAGTVPIIWRPGIVIPPDGRFELQGSLANTLGSAWVMWSERVARDESAIRA
jgi:hypothetical protein